MTDILNNTTINNPFFIHGANELEKNENLLDLILNKYNMFFNFIDKLGFKISSNNKEYIIPDDIYLPRLIKQKIALGLIEPMSNISFENINMNIPWLKDYYNVYIYKYFKINKNDFSLATFYYYKFLLIILLNISEYIANSKNYITHIKLKIYNDLNNYIKQNVNNEKVQKILKFRFKIYTNLDNFKELFELNYNLKNQITYENYCIDLYEFNKKLYKKILYSNIIVDISDIFLKIASFNKVIIENSGNYELELECYKYLLNKSGKIPKRYRKELMIKKSLTDIFRYINKYLVIYTRSFFRLGECLINILFKTTNIDLKVNNEVDISISSKIQIIIDKFTNRIKKIDELLKIKI